LSVHFEQPSISWHFENGIHESVHSLRIRKENEWAKTYQYLKEELGTNIIGDNSSDAVLENSFCCIIANKQIQDSIHHKDDIEKEHNSEVLLLKNHRLTNEDGSEDDVNDKDDVREVVPVHVPKVVRRNDKPALLGRLVVLGVPFVLLVLSLLHL